MNLVISPARLASLQSAEQENNPFVAWDNLAADALAGGSDVLTDGARENAFTGATYDMWRPDVSATTARLTIDLGVARTLSFVAIAAHNLGSLGASVRVQRSSDGVSWTDAGAGLVNADDDRPIGWRMATSGQDFQHWSLYVTGLTAGDAVAVGVAFFGDDLVLPVRLFNGFAPAITPTEGALQSNVSQGGNALSSSVVTRGSRLSLELQHLASDFCRGALWKAFQTAFNEGAQCFLAWRPDRFPEDLHYVWRDGPVLRPVNMGVRDLMSVSLAARVYEG